MNETSQKEIPLRDAPHLLSATKIPERRSTRGPQNEKMILLRVLVSVPWLFFCKFLFSSFHLLLTATNILELTAAVAVAEVNGISPVYLPFHLHVLVANLSASTSIFFS